MVDTGNAQVRIFYLLAHHRIIFFSVYFTVFNSYRYIRTNRWNHPVFERRSRY